MLAAICRAKKARFIHISTDYVFDGEKREPYTEEDEARPISVYGESKREGERRALEANDQALIVRVSWVFGPDRPSFIDAILKKARDEEEISAVADKYATPTYTLDLCALLKPYLAERQEGGLLHLANRGECNWQEYAQWALDCCHAEGLSMKATKVGAASLADMKNFIAKRPVYSVLSTWKVRTCDGTSSPVLARRGGGLRARLRAMRSTAVWKPPLLVVEIRAWRPEPLLQPCSVLRRR